MIPYMKNMTEQQERGKRITELRKQTKQSRRVFAEKYGLSENTLKAWEQGVQGGLTEKGAKTLVQIFRREGLPCSLEWLLNGKRLPIDVAVKSNKQVFNEFISGKNALAEEMALYKKCHPNAVFMTIEDDSMLPTYEMGDMIAGIPIPQKDFLLAVNLICIVETEDEEKLVRRVVPGNQPNSFHLYCTNLESRMERPILYDVGLISIAPVNWHRKLFQF